MDEIRVCKAALWGGQKIFKNDTQDDIIRRLVDVISGADLRPSRIRDAATELAFSYIDWRRSFGDDPDSEAAREAHSAVTDAVFHLKLTCALSRVGTQPGN
jgi:hypothetical protein